MPIANIKKNLGYLQPQSLAKKIGLSKRKNRKFSACFIGYLQS